ncbi:hypothetical protein KAR91_03170, partial [Candidatus Pacearchaeota archaeon]|nr:hypothetical protein [Candidatus Pacearchaeota archaeon]
AFLSMCGCYSYQPNYGTHSKDFLLQIEKNPTRYNSTLCAFEGEVISAQQIGDVTMFQISVTQGSYDYSAASLMVAFNGGNTTVAREHEVKVLGYIGDTMAGQNVFGATVTMPTMVAIGIIDYNKNDFTRRGYYINAEKEIFDKWASGELFVP